MKPVLFALLPLALAACTPSAGDDPAAVAGPGSGATTDAATPDPAQARTAALEVAVAGAWRTPEFTARDGYRNPVQTLDFFGVEPGHTVVEITPGGGWYAEILAPYLREQGQYIAAVVDPDTQTGGRRDYYARSLDTLDGLFARSPAQFDRAQVVRYDPAAPRFGEPGSADVVLTFRNVHNWLENGEAKGMFQGFHDVLKPGGVLGVTEHRAADANAEPGDSGYLGQDRVIALAEGAGFQFESSSEINANPRDTRDHPNGVWTLPPTNNHDAADAQKYADIGESDRMTLRFVKPAQ